MPVKLPPHRATVGRLAVLLTLILLLPGGCQPAPAPAPAVSATSEPWYEVKRVADGDTVQLEIDGQRQWVRLIGIDAPETGAEGNCFAEEATELARQLLSGAAVRLVADASQGERDRYGRLLAYLETEEGDFGLMMLQRGAAREYTYDQPYQRRDQYLTAQAEARQAGLGLWAGDGCARQLSALPADPASGQPEEGVPPLDGQHCPPTHPVKGNIGEFNRIYHEPGRSPNYELTRPERCFSSAAAAEAAGFRPPRNLLPATAPAGTTE